MYLTAWKTFIKNARLVKNCTSSVFLLRNAVSSLGGKQLLDLIN